MLAEIAVLLATLGQTAGGARTVEVELTVAGDPQIAVWLESADGEFVDTLMVTRLVGTYGLGNRPGRPDFGTGYLWPYGRREHTLPVWAHHRGVTYDRIVFQDCKEDWLGWHELVSSHEPFYCRPMTQAEMDVGVDAISCPTTAFSTDKGIPMRLLDPTASPDCENVFARYTTTSVYPPRNDLDTRDQTRDWEGVMELKSMNDLDTVSRATPPAGEPFRVTYGLPAGLAAGDYVVWVEVNQEGDRNAAHAYDFFEDPRLADYGIHSYGQPSVVWQVPLTMGSSQAVSAETLDHAGYGSPFGENGFLNPPDGSITQGRPGSGVERLVAQQGSQGPYKVRVSYRTRTDCEVPAAVAGFTSGALEWNLAETSFVAGDPNEVARYELRFLEGINAISNDTTFDLARPGPEVGFTEQGELVTADFELKAETDYTLAVRAVSHCGDTSPIQSINVRTPLREYATVEPCFIATAAHGSLYETEVVALRGFRDTHLQTNAVGRWFVETYYALSPPIADIIRDEPVLRAATRVALRPLVWIAEQL